MHWTDQSIPALPRVAGPGREPHPTRLRLLDAGLTLLLRRGYHDLGTQELLDTTGIPRGSFYHHFRNKENFALAVVDRYMEGVHGGLDACLGDTSRPPLQRIRAFFEATREKYRGEGYLGCLLGGLGQELSGVNDVFRRRIEACFAAIAARLATCLHEAKAAGDLPAGTDPLPLAELLVDCWEGAALRTRLRRDTAPLDAMLDFYFGTVRAR
jgi:TetR/AcrR family transcriptional regulator, transcriptional repressor for nem operon